MASSLSTISISFLSQPLARYNKNNGSSRKTNLKKHINPMLQFSKRLAAKGLRVTLVTTTAHKNLIQNQSTSSINFEHISNGFNEGQKPDCFNLFVQGLKAESSKTLPKIIEKLENSGYPLNAIVYDACMPWILDIAKEIGLYGVSFFTQSCAVSTIYYHSHKGTVKIPVEKGSMICLPAIPELGICDLPFVNWPTPTRYAARVSPQNHRKEKIVNFGAMCLDLVNTFGRLNKVKTKKIVVFRDGVSEGQFYMVLNEELQDLKMAIYDEHYRPTITLVVAQKRHQTRLFLEDQGGDGRRNISLGTIVDTIIVHPFEFDFYLCSHYGSLGTSKPTHYYVLLDEHKFTSDQLQKLIYQLCFTFA